MFTGLIEGTGKVLRRQPVATGSLVRIGCALSAELAAGDSIAVNGVCLTVTSNTLDSFEATISPETMRVTTLGELAQGDAVNLERPLKADARLGGHFVLGHVDGTGRVRAIEPDGDCYWLDVEIPGHLVPYVIPKGSIAIDGISLTIAALDGASVRVQIVPFTWTHTALSSARSGDAVNIEADVIGKYIARLLGDRVSLPEWPELPAVIK